ncbi:hypothetical protein NE237_024648 [Protea cynaroides]|uniref:Uncharacterized protein n=1 Tax=Protea cynaroides TaxID=273540 RepID=A0A9Q0H4M6_9MAGN|nr:hypothetical protein NE237_024648 [Protea cynaroides]
MVYNDHGKVASMKLFSEQVHMVLTVLVILPRSGSFFCFALAARLIFCEAKYHSCILLLVAGFEDSRGLEMEVWWQSGVSIHYLWVNIHVHSFACIYIYCLKLLGSISSHSTCEIHLSLSLLLLSFFFYWPPFESIFTVIALYLYPSDVIVFPLPQEETDKMQS